MQLVINIIQSEPVNHTLFESLCHDSRSDSLAATTSHWRLLACLAAKHYRDCLKLLIKVFVSLKEHFHSLTANVWRHLSGLCIWYIFPPNWIMSRARDSHIHNIHKVNGCIKEVQLWERKCEGGDVSCFPYCLMTILPAQMLTRPVVKAVKVHLSKVNTLYLNKDWTLSVWMKAKHQPSFKTTRKPDGLVL